MVTLLFLAPLVYWYITIPEILYIFFAGIWSVAKGEVWGELYLIGLAVYYTMFLFHPVGTMAVTGILILIHLVWHVYLGFTGKTGNYVPDYTESDITHGDNQIFDSCPYCGSSNTDGNHCYDCGEDY